MTFDKDSAKNLKKVVGRLSGLDEELRKEQEVRSSIAMAVIRETFPGLDDEVLAGICHAIGYVAAEIAVLQVQDASDALINIYMAYHLAAARYLKLYDCDTPAVDLKKEKVTPTSPLNDEMTGGYL